jgi:hypothetical protein
MQINKHAWYIGLLFGCVFGAVFTVLMIHREKSPMPDSSKQNPLVITNTKTGEEYDISNANVPLQITFWDERDKYVRACFMTDPKTNKRFLCIMSKKDGTITVCPD